ncbi:NAD(P)H-hydrate epimerase [Halobellus rarus]|uniref:NAD(P)H-hydrate epimerase n=1 Tax=Halobellus rarus TaxID=1126237 RepID=A0ABD6CNA5_9EURY|nr:NAD(P)H-hydrate epimerase [Halobellus rarus]
MATGRFHTSTGTPVPAVTAETMRRVDRVAVDDVGIELLQMMEHAGRTLAFHVLRVGGGSALVVAGNGGNGGGLACARHLANREVDVSLVLDRDPDELTGAAAQQHRILQQMGVPTHVGPGFVSENDSADVVVDALIGYGLTGPVREPADELIRAVNRHGAPAVSLDVPSGVDATTGETLGDAVDPDRTVTLGLPKTGLRDRAETVFLADLGIPRAVYDRLEIEYENPFGRGFWVGLRA